MLGLERAEVIGTGKFESCAFYMLYLLTQHFLLFSFTTTLPPFLFYFYRLIDEMRCIWVPKCTHPVVEVGPTDPEPNNLQTDTFENFGW